GRGDRQDLLPRAGPRPAAAGELLARADLRRPRPDPGPGDGSFQEPLMGVTAFNRTLDQELTAIARGASFECLVCGGFLLKRPLAHACLECGTLLCDGLEVPQSE